MSTQTAGRSEKDGAGSVWEEKRLSRDSNTENETSANPTLRGPRTFPLAHLDLMKMSDLSPFETSESQNLPTDNEHKEQIRSKTATASPESPALDFELEVIYPSSYYTVLIMVSVNVVLFLFSIDRTIITVAM